MKKGDLLWALALSLIIAILTIPATHHLFITLTKNHPYLMGFVKVSILATLGELLAIRIVIGDFVKPVGVFWRFFIWGLLGMSFALIFPLFNSGVRTAIEIGLLPSFHENTIVTPLLISAAMNLIFAPTMMGLHRITDTYIELCNGEVANFKNVSLENVVRHIDWKGLIGFVYLKTIPFFWIPAHTLTFMLPSEYRVLAASFLSIALGGILAFAKKKKK
ncbi:MAG: hypothetical protein N4A62_10285 [Marinisporobacter sp.]|jgi:hypothetical protein|nr:hypothetical protein [Marinisporobacter sp.]